MTYYEFARNYNFHYRKPPKIRPIIWKIQKNLRIRPIYRDIFGLKYLFSAESACLAWCALIRQLQNRFQN